MVNLNSPVQIQAAVMATSFVVLENHDNPVNGTLKSLVELNEDKSQHVWVDVYGPQAKDAAEYNPEWTDADVEAAVQAHFAGLE